MNLSQLINSSDSIKELSEAIPLIEHRLSQLKDEKLIEAKKQFEDVANSLGVDINTILEAKPKRKKSVPVPKYRNPQNTSETWTGRCKMPAWLKDKLDEGHTTAEFMI